jgi:asparagine synthase (glutamine-hydrolysing)
VSDVPLGAFLSGGIDSSLVVALMAMETSNSVKTFSIGFNDETFNELPYARRVAERYKTDHHEEMVEPDVEELLPGIIRNFDEPFADSSAIPTYFVAKMARRHVTVALSGDGGDEIFGGYGRYWDNRTAILLDRMPRWLKSSVLKSVAQILPEGTRGLNTLRYLCADADERYVAKMTRGLSEYYTKVFCPSFLSELRHNSPVGSEVRSSLGIAGELDALSRRQFADIKNYLVGDILTKVDRASMLASLEVRAPLLDHQLAEFACTIPQHVKARGQEPKHILRVLAKKYLPREILSRPKMGFAVPIKRWINEEWFDLSQDLVVSERALGRGILNPSHPMRLLREHQSGLRDHSGAIWSLMVLEMWYREYIDKQPASSTVHRSFP